MSLVHVVAVITAHSGKREEILSAFKKNVPLVHQEEGCIEYGAVIDTENVGPFQEKLGEDTFFVIEKWESLDHLMFYALEENESHQRDVEPEYSRLELSNYGLKGQMSTTACPLSSPCLQDYYRNPCDE